MPFACTCAPVFRGGLAEAVHANGKIELSVWTAAVATQSSQGPELSGGPQLGESMSDVGMAVGFGVQAARKHISYIRSLSRFIFSLEQECIFLQSGGIESVALNLECFRKKSD